MLPETLAIAISQSMPAEHGNGSRGQSPWLPASNEAPNRLLTRVCVCPQWLRASEAVRCDVFEIEMEGQADAAVSLLDEIRPTDAEEAEVKSATPDVLRTSAQNTPWLTRWTVLGRR